MTKNNEQEISSIKIIKKPDPLVEKFLDLIDILPLKTVDYAFAYGSCKKIEKKFFLIF